jgi:hypothetical protein
MRCSTFFPGCRPKTETCWELNTWINKRNIHYKDSGPHKGVAEDLGLVGCHLVSLGDCFSTFRMYILLSSFKIQGVQAELLVLHCSTTCDIPKKYESPRTHVYFYCYVTLSYFMLWYVTLYYVTLSYIALCYVTLRYITLCCVICYVTLRYVMLCLLHYATLRYVMLYVMLRYVTLRYVMLYVILCYVTLHCVMLSYVMLYVMLYYVMLCL